MNKQLRSCVYAFDKDDQGYNFPTSFYKALYEIMSMIVGEEIPWQISIEDDEMVYPIKETSPLMQHPLFYRLKDMRSLLIEMSKQGVMVWREDLLLFFVKSLEKLAFPKKSSGREDVRMGFGHEILYMVCDLLLELQRSDNNEGNQINSPVLIETSDISVWLSADCQSHEKLRPLQGELIRLNKNPSLVSRWIGEL